MVNYFQETENCRVFKVLKYPAEVHFIVQNTVGLQHCTAWRPIRNMIATQIYSNKRCEIGFFEKNGQIFSSFKLENNVFIVNNY